ncbi:S8 family serine peptidase [Terrisporobacter petrolearius]
MHPLCETSMATPHATGSLALLIKKQYRFTANGNDIII